MTQFAHYQNTTSTLLEAVPNISEAQCQDTLDLIVSELKRKKVDILNVDRGIGVNRTVITMVGETEQIREASLRLVEIAMDRIDLRVHKGAHPRIGAVDVLPIVPLACLQTRSTTESQTHLASCALLTDDLAKVISTQFEIPIYLYEASARHPSRRNLAKIRQGEFEGLASKMKAIEWLPDYGPNEPHPSFGALALGSRDILIAYNITLDSSDLAIAKEIAREIRNLPCVKAIGWFIPEYRKTQVSFNLVDFRTTGIYRVFQKTKELSADRGVRVLGSELIGLVPWRALSRISSEHEVSSVEELKQNKDFVSLNLGLHHPFEIDQRVIEIRLETK